ncbi:hypothetical protein SAMN04488073_2293 [Marinobacter gudaonensis]|uniref:Uncharacterized protein n=1 Tax=Marinobacter gudaonensis TaxID=375760 RepID=A0A1I6H4L9_9GAMM|nr:hypothetical protein [Marinobacter gudaonensis]SFR49446.1 hypothetical protein SAMN04488073_2293 [Marinobacter gudaonensis]
MLDPQSTSAPLFKSVIIPALLFLLPLLAAQSQADTLSNQKVASFIESVRAAERLAPEFEELDRQMENQNDGTMPDFSRIVSESIAQMRGHEAYDRLEDVVQDHGFDNLEEWGSTGDRVFQAWMAIEMAEQNPAARREMEAAIAEMESSPHMTAEQKAQMRAMMEGAMGAMESASDAPEADIEAVRPHLKALRQLGEE